MDTPTYIGIVGSGIGALGLVRLAKDYLRLPFNRYTQMEQAQTASAKKCEEANAELQKQIDAIKREQLDSALGIQMRLHQSMERNSNCMEENTSVLRQVASYFRESTPAMGSRVIADTTLIRKDASAS